MYTGTIWDIVMKYKNNYTFDFAEHAVCRIAGVPLYLNLMFSTFE